MLLSFSTEMSSLAYQNIYDWLEIYESLKYPGDTPKKDMPIAVRDKQDTLIDEMIDFSDHVLEQIVNWAASATIQSRTVQDVLRMDELLHGKLSDYDVIEPAIAQAEKSVTLRDTLEDYR